MITQVTSCGEVATGVISDASFAPPHLLIRCTGAKWAVLRNDQGIPRSIGTTVPGMLRIGIVALFVTFVYNFML
ncbi:uncharacterized protein N7483_000996 [Penicillium malachiteum]|uniref:uncharacterized protein n=1 Tax=Penicillium malachiteum TaxID=1324776 RepID=UPI002547CE3E|nr:uncharacterized protein N7483_000996 [Penicillium malachiteum]KAJ5735871.1 hypothetical protein N7483_000996 [Penicillium malachiteum]